ncbi:MAG TPA: hypothetical protein VIV58_22370, partial [Kofleriaceae bacterium]
VRSSRPARCCSGARVPGGGEDRAPRDHDHLTLTVPVADRHFWSPWLAIEVSPRGEHAHLFARFSPHPSVWTGFAFGHLGLGLICAVAVVIAASSLLVPNSGQPWALALAGGAALAMGAMWWASKVGQRMAHGQMTALRAELDRALESLGRY